MNPNDNKNNKNNKPGGNWRGVASLVGWALLLTIIFSYASPKKYEYQTINT